MEIIKITTDNFVDLVEKSSEPILIDFWANWCNPCKMLSPIIQQVANEGKKVGKVDVDSEAELAVKFNISSIPTLILFENGEIKKKSIGVVSKEEVLEMFND